MLNVLINKLNIFSHIGRVAIGFSFSIIDSFKNFLRFCNFTLIVFSKSFKSPFYFKLFLNQIVIIGFFSIPVISLTAIFSGAVLALQSYFGMSRFSAESGVPMIVILSLTRELSPVLSGLLISGRVGAFLTAEIATMRVTDQIDAMYTLSTDPIKYIVVPRIIATIISLPILVIIFDILGFTGGYLVAVYQLKFSGPLYIYNSVKFIKFADIMSGMVKGFFFGLILSINSCYKGYYATGGAKGVGLSTTEAVVSSSIIILVSNYLITKYFI